ncbi:SusD/RagB family nutrient-binding outer membrane lipoprotein [Segetibacter sp. 3557_3]|uniref:SusD/RagB family nutrient-binding outer membrane lipoprotein n=1 Tax=Segetibacter sp. 3557_3 TaxID=2547429 RepID=UPI001058BB2A|nr:SusD/RagB family nutrient-binding outer membrane lipoprotein [Segetibacter sp. 3557_3]TDH21308.1 SusD/RagB family nutrient-binding outer membrane lipoprotein [Segetibacter sp. 3557_3]
MKKILTGFILGTVLMVSQSCKKYLDINVNPNNATYSTPELVLPQAITRTAQNVVTFNNYGGQAVGYFANGGGVSGWGSIISYNYTTSEFSNLWGNTYDILQDFQYVLEGTKGKTSYAYYNAAAKIMKAYNFQLLVDTYNDVPYTDAFQGTTNLQPKYDKAEDIYKDLAVQLDSAILIIKTARSQTEDDKKPMALTSAADVMFKGDVSKWIQLANTIKLRLIVRAKDKVAFVNTTFDNSGFLEDDAIINPGYARIDGKQNPHWDAFAYSPANAARTVGAQYVPTPFILSFYDDSKLVDTGRGRVTYKAWTGTNGVNTPKNQLGYQGSDAARGATPNSWFIGTSATDYTQLGIFKGFDAGQPIFLLSEVFFLQAEANVRGILTGDAATNFNKGIEASFRYLYKNAQNTVAAGRNPTTAAANYIAANNTRYLANFALATTNDQKIEAIITQKYIALNMIHSHEAWNEYRRTGYPRVVAGSSDAKLTFASSVSQANRPDRLPTRILYPETEFRYNQANVPKNVTSTSSKIFWAL